MMALTISARVVRSAVGAGLQGSGVHVGQDLVLDKLHRHGSLTLGELAKILDVEVPTATRTTQRMQAAGLVRRIKDPTDARQVRIELTDHGREVRAVVRQVQNKVARKAFRGIDADKRAELTALLWHVFFNITDER